MKYDVEGYCPIREACPSGEWADVQDFHVDQDEAAKRAADRDAQGVWGIYWPLVRIARVRVQVEEI